jgi:hypothetical protein
MASRVRRASDARRDVRRRRRSAHLDARARDDARAMATPAVKTLGCARRARANARSIDARRRDDARARTTR